MLTVTEKAATELEELLRFNKAAPGQCMKLIPTGPGTVEMVIDTPGEGDEVIRRGDEPPLIVDGRIREDLDGGEIDCDTRDLNGETTPQFILLPPTARR